MGSLDAGFELPWVKTPCIQSIPLSKAAGCNIYLKLENLQPSGSFKSRGIGNFMTQAAASRSEVHFYCPSGGNAGLACATSARRLGCPATVVIPILTPPMMRRKLEDLGVEVHQVGKNWPEADRYLREELLAKDPTGVYVPPFDHPHVWAGAATLVDELREQVPGAIDGIVCSVGGGGLVNGVMQGSAACTPPPRVIAVETQGADSLNASVVAGEHVTIPGITSIAISLGATRVSEQTWRYAQQERMHSVVVSDADAALSCVRFADDARLLVEAACGATLAPAYKKGELRRLVGGEGIADEEWAKKNVVLVVCGGSIVTLDLLDKYHKEYAGQSSIEV